MARRLYPVLFLIIVACDRTCGSRTEPTAADAAPPAVPATDDMVHVPAGPFLMGDPPHEIDLDEFGIDRHEVTQGEYDRCVAAKVCARAYFVFGPPPPRHPVVNVTSDDAATYCAWAGKQLPTAAQWEKAARGVDGRLYPWGDAPPTCERAMFEHWAPERYDACGEKDPFNATHPVGSHPTGASPYGALDMAGNVKEWTASFEGPYRVVRSGRSDDQLKTTYQELVIEPSEHNKVRNQREPLLGFRCVRNPRGREIPR